MTNFDQAQAQRQLDLLGYTPEETVFLRFFFHSSDPRSGALNVSGIDPTVIEKHQVDGRGCYLVVNGGGNKDENVTHCRALFYEHDDLDKESQLLLWKTLELPEPTFQVDTGGKSIHSYWVLNKPVSPQEWKPLQKDLLEYADADRSNKNPSRVMRLAGAWHVSPEGTSQTKIVTESGKRYSFEELRAVVPVQEDKPVVSKPAPVNAAVKRSPVSNQLPRHPDLIQLPVLESVPLLLCLPHEIRGKVANGVAIGTGHNNEAVGAVGQCIYEYAEYLTSIGQPFYPSAEDLFTQFSQTSGVNQRETQMRIDWLEKCQRHDPQFKKSVENCVRGWYWNTHVRPLKEKTVEPQDAKNAIVGTTPSVVPTPSNPDGASFKAIVVGVEEILALEGKSEIEKRFLLSQYQKETNCDRKIFDEIIQDLIGKQEIEESLERPSLQSDVSELDIQYILPGLAEDIRKAAKKSGIDPAMIVHYLIPAIGALVGPRLKLEINGTHVEPAIAWHIVVESSGEGKTRALDLITPWFKARQKESKDKFDQDLKNYQVEKAVWDKEFKQDPENAGEEPVKPERERYFLLGKTTPEALNSILGGQKYGVFQPRDEVGGMFKGMGQYSKGENEHTESLLECHGGAGVDVTRMRAEARVYSTQSHLCIAGGIQPGIFNQIFSDPNDSQGLQARFQFLVPEQSSGKYCRDRNKKALSLPKKLDKLFWTLMDDRSDPTTNLIQLSEEAFNLVADYHDEVKAQSRASNNLAIKAWLSKLAQTMIGRYTLLLHSFDHAQSQNNDGFNLGVIGTETVRRAIHFCEFLRGQFLRLQKQATKDVTDLDALILRIQGVALSAGKVTAREVHRKEETLIERIAKQQKRKPSVIAKDLLKSAAKDGRFLVQKKGQSLFLVPNHAATLSPEVSKASILPPTPTTIAETLEEKGVETVGESITVVPTMQKNEALTTQQVEDATPEDWVEILKNWTEEEIETQVLLSEKFTEVVPRYEQAKRLFTGSNGMANEPKPNGNGHRQVDIDRPSPKDSNGSNADAGGVLPRDEASNMELVSGGASTLAGLHPNPPDRTPELRPHSPTHPRDVDGSS